MPLSINLVTFLQKWHILKSHTCRAFWWTLQPFLCKIWLVGSFGNFRIFPTLIISSRSFCLLWKSPAKLSDQMLLDPKKYVMKKSYKTQFWFNFFFLFYKNNLFLFELRLYIRTFWKIDIIIFFKNSFKKYYPLKFACHYKSNQNMELFHNKIFHQNKINIIFKQLPPFEFCLKMAVILRVKRKSLKYGLQPFLELVTKLIDMRKNIFRYRFLEWLFIK